MGWSWGKAALGAVAGGPAGALVGGYWNDINKGMERGGEYRGVDRGNFDVPEYVSQRNKYNEIAYADPRQAPQAQARMAKERGNRRRQSRIGQMLMAEAKGNGPAQKLARLNAEQMADRGVAQQMAMASSGRPGQGAMASQNAAMNAADIQSRVGEQATNAGLAAQMQAQQLASGHFTGARGQDQNMAQFNSAQRNNMNQFNADARLRQLGLDDRRQMEALGQRLQLAQMQQQGGMEYERNRTQRYGYNMGTPTGMERILGFGVNAGQMAMAMGGGRA